MPKIIWTDTAPTQATVVVGVLAGASGPQLAPGAERIEAALGGRLATALRAVEATGKPDEVFKLPTLGQAPFALVVATGIGPRLDAESARRAVGAALRALPKHADVHVALAADPGAIVEGALLGAHTFTAYKSDGAPPALSLLTIAGPASDDAQAAVNRAQVVADAVTLTRDLVNTPANDLYPQSFAERAQRLAREHGLEFEALDEQALRRGGYGGLLAVGGGSVRPPRLVRVAYRPSLPRARVALVGKGITFDSGGLDLKTGAQMSTMKCDMGGAAAALATVAAIADLRLPVEVAATLPLAENMPSGTAYRPKDVVTIRGGRTVEIDNTDAEGRIVLVDAIARATEDSPDCLIELSTLTGGQVVALGDRVAGVMGSPELRATIVAAGEEAGEALWPMPLPDDQRARLDSPIADITNVPSDARGASMLIAGVFLREFVPDGMQWVHIDIAGPAWNSAAPYGYTPTGGTGAPVRALIAAIERLAA
ncbi:MAG: leucyl aminopeptidase [Actinomycetia bacterium]|nr:leucyl aminopeptidase [Actinomycetes bacterium]